MEDKYHKVQNKILTVFMSCKVDTNSCKNIMGYTLCDDLHKIILTLLSLMQNSIMGFLC